ncbi:MAG: tetratricopeptide repeat protein [Bacteroidetes bacterium]|nr:tetratricopeptide repeat protein [Bacteroidota bacterium]
MSKQDCKKITEQAWQKFFEKDFQSSVDIFEEVLEAEEENKEAIYGKACALFRLLDYDAAEKDYNKLIKISPNDSKLFHARGLLKGADENAEGAIKDLEKAFDLEPESAEACQDLAFAYLTAEEYNKAALAFEKLVELHKNCPQGWCGKGLVALFKKEHKKAVEYFNLAIKSEPNYLLALLARADAYLELGKTAEAQRDLKKVLGIDAKIFDKKSEDLEDDDENINEDDEIEEFDIDD